MLYLVKLKGSIPFCLGHDQKIFGNGLAPVQIFHAIPSSLFSAAAELVTLKHPRRPTQSSALEERFGKAKYSIVASSVPEYYILMYQDMSYPHNMEENHLERKGI